MDQTFQVGENRYARIALHAFHEATTATGHDHIDFAVKTLEHFTNRGAVSGWHQLDGVFLASPAVAGEAIFLRSDRHLYRIEK